MVTITNYTMTPNRNAAMRFIGCDFDADLRRYGVFIVVLGAFAYFSRALTFSISLCLSYQLHSLTFYKVGNKKAPNLFYPT
jgi:hypothetical protein